MSPLQRLLKVGQILAQRGFQYQVAPEIIEINFGAWEGSPWEQLANYEIEDWCNNFAHFAPDDGESLHQLFDRVEGWLSVRAIEKNAEKQPTPILTVGHADWINAAKIIAYRQDVPKVTSEWPRSINYKLSSV